MKLVHRKRLPLKRGSVTVLLTWLGIEFRKRQGQDFWEANRVTLHDIYAELLSSARDTFKELHPDVGGNADEFKEFVAALADAKKKFAWHLQSAPKPLPSTVLFIPKGHCGCGRLKSHVGGCQYRTDRYNPHPGKGIPKSAEHRAKIGNAHRGRPKPEHVREAMTRGRLKRTPARKAAARRVFQARFDSGEWYRDHLGRVRKKLREAA